MPARFKQREEPPLLPAAGDAGPGNAHSWTSGEAKNLRGVQEAALAAWVVTLMAPLAEANARQHETLVSQAERLEAQAETIGRQSAELERATSAVVALGDELAVAESSRRREHRRLRIGLAVAGALAVAAVVAPAWVR